MHNSDKIDVFLSIASNPIIEGCHSTRFAPYPQPLLRSDRLEDVSIHGTLRSKLMLLLFKMRGSSLAVQDFSHIRNTPSPNWVHMDEPDMTRPWPEGSLSNKVEVEASLQDILPS